MVEAAGVRLEGVNYSIGEFTLADVRLEVPAGQYFVLMGPNGSGKTILLKLLSGILFPDSGEVFIGEAKVTGMPPWERGIGYMPQDYALFPDRTVYRNISFGLEVRKTGKEEARKEVGGMAEMLGIDRLLDRMPETLSGGECQKVGLARALVIKPRLLLLDEPVSAVDEENRTFICGELKRIQEHFKVTTVHVSHSRSEAELVADRIGVLRDGRLAGLDSSGA